MSGTRAVDEVAGSPDGIGTLERRRPGRVEYDNPALLALLRRSSRAAVVPDPDDGSAPFQTEDQLAPARGIAVGVVISGLAWAMIGGSVWMLLLLRG